ncbi:MFS transporter [Paenirhodobacter enshiensis]|uniref:Multidrug MFS transporter n=1 Tax=Paenirhodobacter enshiensis TaxID=1105367 RepID=A0A086XZR3_9RHOB|nr:MFS transporter [Paenirhodobacter enshiensis]KFI27513.1 multidrug MFS transporter [Paenirhodobacter enshiensis]
MTPVSAPSAARRLSLVEFVALMATLISTVAFSIDAMLPSLPEIAAELSPDDVNRAQLILGVFMLGMGIGTFVTGPLSDAIGRKPTLIGGMAIYIAGAIASSLSTDLTLLLAGRFLQGLGASGARTVPMALIRDLHAGPQMARITSIIMTCFIIVPAFAPMAGGLIAHWAGWRGVFWAFVLFGAIGAVWLGLRQPETLRPEDRRRLDLRALLAGVREVLANRNVRILTAVLALGFGQMFAMLSSAKQVYMAYGVDKTFPYWFGAVALMGGTASIVNAKLVMRLGMFRIARGAFAMQVVSSAVMLGLHFAGLGPGWTGLIVLFLWNGSVVCVASLAFGNLNAMAMQPMGHLAGTTVSVTTALSTVAAVALIAAPVGLAFDGTAVPLVGATLCCSALAWALMGRVTR